MSAGEPPRPGWKDGWPDGTDSHHPAQRNTAGSGERVQHRTRGFPRSDHVDGCSTLDRSDDIGIGEGTLNQAAGINGIERRAQNNRKLFAKLGHRQRVHAALTPRFS
jgi:hypothetical protein